MFGGGMLIKQIQMSTLFLLMSLLMRVHQLSNIE